jgi:hypothetical protein
MHAEIRAVIDISADLKILKNIYIPQSIIESCVYTPKYFCILNCMIKQSEFPQQLVTSNIEKLSTGNYGI